MKNTNILLNTIALLMGIKGFAMQSPADHEKHSTSHEIQHGFVLAADDMFASHLVATGHHSRQTEIIGKLTIEDHQELEFYEVRKKQGSGNSYFLFQAQNLDLPSLSDGQILTGHIIESKVGDYEPKNKIVTTASFRVEKVLLNIPNPFFTGESQPRSSCSAQHSIQKECNPVGNFLNLSKPQKPHCCDSGKKPCNWKC